MGGACVGTEVRQGRIAGIVVLLALAAILVLSWMLERPPTPVSAVGRSTAPPSRVGCITWSLRGRDPARPGRSYWLPITTPPSAALAASDDKSSVAAMLETARALASGEPLRNDIVMIFTDGEEAGLLGASSFVAEHPGGAQGGVVLNWKATGNAGSSVLFETSSGNAELIKEFAASAPYPIGDSAMAALYQAGTQNTDFTAFAMPGLSGSTSHSLTAWRGTTTGHDQVRACAQRPNGSRA